MESLIGYGSDDSYDDVSQSKRQSSSQADVNYEEVQMDLSEESNDSTKLDSRRHSSDYYHSKNKDSYSEAKEKEYAEKDRYKKSERDRYSPKKEDKCRDRTKNDEDRRSREKEDRNRDKEDRSRDKEERKSREREDRNREYKSDRSRDRNKSRDERPRDIRKGRDDQDRYRDRTHDSHDNKDDRRPRRTSSRERHRSRSPRRSDYASKRSNSRDKGRLAYPKRYDRTSSKMDRLEKLGIELNASGSGGFAGSSSYSNNDKEPEKDRFYMAGITGRFTEQIQRRKMLWQKKDGKEGQPEPSTTVAQPEKVWQNTTFAQDTDGKVANKFKRLMGIRGSESEGMKSTDGLKKQEEMFSSMEAQYEVARTATHTMRGVGLGFGSFQR